MRVCVVTCVVHAHMHDCFDFVAQHASWSCTASGLAGPLGSKGTCAGADSAEDVRQGMHYTALRYTWTRAVRRSGARSVIRARTTMGGALSRAFFRGLALTSHPPLSHVGGVEPTAAAKQYWHSVLTRLPPVEPTPLCAEVWTGLFECFLSGWTTLPCLGSPRSGHIMRTPCTTPLLPPLCSYGDEAATGQ